MKGLLGFSALGALAMVVGALGCSSSSSTDSAFGAGEGPSGPSSPSGPETPAASPGSNASQNGNGVVAAGILTAGAWDDNRNFDFFKAYAKKEEPSLQGLPIFAAQDREAASAQFSGDRAAKQVIDIAFLLDTTGSMGDELAYLQKEIENIGGAVKSAFPGSDPRWGLVVYRDVVDPYVKRVFDFQSDIASFKSNLDAQSADGGGDYEEAADVGLQAMSNLTWRAGDGAAKLVFWVADAPHHVADTQTVVSAIDASRQKGVHIYPVAASGADDRTEYTMRSAAQITGGRYLFLTNDSGVGNDHKEPVVPCYFVTKLSDALVRMVALEMSGKYKEPDASEIVRIGGNPDNGRCTLDDGQAVTAF